MHKYIANLTVVVLAFVGLSAAADITPADQLTMEVHRIAEPQKTDTVTDNCTDTSFGIGDLGDIIEIGEKIWQIIEQGKPVVNVQQMPMVAALPKGFNCWQSLANWSAPATQSYQVTYKNAYGMAVVDFKYRLQYSYGGQVGGVGKYLANVTIVPSDLNVDWGYEFDSGVQVGDALNVGSDSAPVAGMDMTLNWVVKTVLKQNNSSSHFFVQGDGNVKADLN